MPRHRRVLVSWSSGKDSAWALAVLRRQPGVEIAGLLTTFAERTDRVPIHGVRRSLVEAQAAALGLPLHAVSLPQPCPNLEYERRVRRALGRARSRGITHLAFGDLYLEDVREYRVGLLSGTGIEPLFPVWCSAEETPELARRMIDGGLRPLLTCVDRSRLPAALTGRPFDRELLAVLPPDVDPCGERGEFHTFCTGGPTFDREVAVEVGETVERDGFALADLSTATRSDRPMPEPQCRDGEATLPASFSSTR